MTRQQRKEIERELCRYEQNKKKAAEYVASHAFDNFSVDYSSERVKSSMKNSPEKRLIAEIDEAERAWKWCRVFERTKDRFLCDPIDGVVAVHVMDDRFIRHHKNADSFAIRYHASRSWYYRCLNYIFLVAEYWAMEYGLL